MCSSKKDDDDNVVIYLSEQADNHSKNVSCDFCSLTISKKTPPALKLKAVCIECYKKRETTCIECDETINPARKLATNGTLHCIECARNIEKKNKHLSKNHRGDLPPEYSF